LDKDSFRNGHDIKTRVEDRLQGAQNFPTWKEKITKILDVNDVLEHVDDKATTPMNVALLGVWKKGEANAMSIILDGVKYHIIPHLSGKTSVEDIWTTLGSLYQSKNENKIMVLRERMEVQRWQRAKVWFPTSLVLHKSGMSLQLGSKTEDFELVRIALNGFSKPWDTFVRGIVAREKLPN
jgi:hypothetical protein